MQNSVTGCTHTKLNEGRPQDFKYMVAIGQANSQFATAEAQLEVNETTFRLKFTVMTNLTSSLISFCSDNARVSSSYVSRKHFFSCFVGAIETKDWKTSKVFEPILNPLEVILVQGQRTKISVRSPFYTDHESNGIIQHSVLLESH